MQLKPGCFLHRAKVQVLRHFIVLLSYAILHPGLHAAESKIWDCQPSREYVTVYNYLREESPLELRDEERQQTAWQVAKGCHRSAWRFIQVMNTLIKADISPRHALQTAVELSDGDDMRVKVFLTAFKLAHASDFLDLDLLQSLALARRLSIDFLHVPHWLEPDFRKLVLFCVSEKALNLPRPQCGEWAAKLVLPTAKKTQDGEVLKIGVAKPFFKGFEFLTGKSGPELSTGDALQLLTQLLKISPYTIQNFMESYEFAVSNKGLKLDRSQAIHFASELAKLSAYPTLSDELSIQKRKLN